MEKCTWIEDEGQWESECKESWVFNDGGPKENGCKFCMFCGKPLMVNSINEEEV